VRIVVVVAVVGVSSHGTKSAVSDTECLVVLLGFTANLGGVTVI
jgi:hypothetical protein